MPSNNNGDSLLKRSSIKLRSSNEKVVIVFSFSLLTVLLINYKPPTFQACIGFHLANLFALRRRSVYFTVRSWVNNFSATCLFRWREGSHRAWITNRLLQRAKQTKTARRLEVGRKTASITTKPFIAPQPGGFCALHSVWQPYFYFGTVHHTTPCLYINTTDGATDAYPVTSSLFVI